MNPPRAFKITHISVLSTMVAALTMAGTLAAAPAAAPSPQAAVTARQAGYKKMGGAMKALNEQLKSDAPAKDVMVGAARTLATTAREQPRLFPAGSGPTAGVHTDALPDIWTDRATFDAQMGKLIAETGKLLTITNGGDVAAIRAQAKATGATCSGCHRQFRADS
ncbi:cytochrome C [Sphingomonas oleivorans]|uniref:Cytochrome C n=1 Tax=Sphingomonas oleivorans TaxID=1735121 RepID=A0A2T5G0U3_9SPHN|nr:cytochrome c [Sphingomonas oleivorans]PTQ12754.1 cytochrome C [Sphingomonas oleivorans]